MASLNQRNPSLYTYEGAKAKHISPYQLLRRSVCSCMLWEKEFYEDGLSIAERIEKTVLQCNPEEVGQLAVDARSLFKLRHVPLLLARTLAGQSYKGTAKVLSEIIQRPDELAEFLSLYWNKGKCPLSAQVKKGLASAFTKFNAYQLGKYNRLDKAIKLRDVLFLCHAKPKDEGQAELWKQLVDNTLPIPDTWEVALSAGKDKKETWERLLREKKLGGLALLRNLRNMIQAGVSDDAVIQGLSDMKTNRILPFRFIAAAGHAVKYEPYIETAMLNCLLNEEKLKGRTILLVDVSRSMDWPLSAKSDLTRLDAANGLAILLREICEKVEVFTFSNDLVQAAARRGFALRDAIINSQMHSRTHLGDAISGVSRADIDRLIVITDEQSHDRVPDPINYKGYMINVASAQNGVGYGPWIHVDGFSEAVVSWIREYEKETDRKEGV